MFSFLNRRKTIIRIFSILIILYGLSGIYLSNELKEERNSRIYGDGRNLTNMAAVLTIFILLIPVLNIHRLSTFHLIFLPSIFALEFLVTVVYWFLKIYDERLVSIPIRLVKENRVGYFNDFTLHGFPFLIIIWELFNFTCTINFKNIFLIFNFSFFYYGILKLTKIYEGQYPYEFLNLMNEYHILKGKDGKVIDATFASEILVDEGEVKMESWKEYATGIRPVVKVPIQRERQFTAEEIEELEQIEKAMEELKNMEMEIIVNPDGQEIVKITKPFSSSPTYMTMEEAQQIESFGVKKPKPIKFDISDEIDIAEQEERRSQQALQEEGVEESNAITGMENVEITSSQTPASKLRKLFGASKTEMQQMQGGGYMTDETTTSGGQKRSGGGYMTDETTTSGGQKRPSGGYMTEETTTSGGQRRPGGGYMTEETTTSGGQRRPSGGYMTTEETVTEMGRRRPSGGSMVTEETTYSMDGKTDQQRSNEAIDKMKSKLKNPEKHMIFQLKPNHTLKSISSAFDEKTVGLFDEERKAFREIKKDVPNLAKTMKTDESDLMKTLLNLPVAIFNEIKDRMKHVPGQKKQPNLLLDPVNWDEKKTNAYMKAFVPDDFKRAVLENRIKEALKRAGVPDNSKAPQSQSNIVGVTTPKAGYNDTFEIHRAPVGSGNKDVSPEVINKLLQNQNPNQTINSVNRFSGPVGSSTFK